MPLAAGGMARIYIGRSTGIGSFERHVVLKMITPERANDQVAVSMFLDEARLAASLNHQNVGQVFEVGEDQGIHYLAMEYVHGQDLRAVLAKAGSQGTRIPLELALTVVAGAAAGLNHAHERRGPDGTPLGIVHRDVSPSNLMIGYDGAVKLLDFGIAKATARSVETQSGIIKGMFAYMAPEQCRGREVDRRSDVFSLGIILYEVSTQHRCFRADSDFDTMHRIVTGDVVRPTRLVHGYPPALEAIVMKALAVDAAQRYQSAGLLLEALEAFAVSSRMSLSTMGLGRFMRDMFGDVMEPWLNTAATKVLQPIAAKESTISSTDGKGSGVHSARLPLASPIDDGIPDDDVSFADSGRAEAAMTTLDLPRRPRMEAPESLDDDWNPRTYPATSADSGPSLRPSYPGSADRPSYPPPLPSPPLGVPTSPMGMSQMPHGTQPMPMGQRTSSPALGIAAAQTGPMPREMGPSPTAFSQVPGSGSGPAIPAVGVSTKHGYASGGMSRGDVSYPRYDAPGDVYSQVGDLKPNRRPLFIGLGIAVVGLIVILAVSLGGSKDNDHAVLPEDEGSGSDTPTTGVTAPEGSAVVEAKAPPPPDVAEESMVSVVIQSEPSGADVVIAGTKLGVTPFDKKLKRGTKIVQLAVHLDGYVDFSTKIDLGGEYENKNVKLVRVEDAAKGSAVPQAVESSTTDGDETDTSSTDKTDKPDAADRTGTTAAKASAKTQTKATSTAKTSTRTTTPKTTTKASTVTREKDKTPKCQKPGPNVDPFSSIPICSN